MNASGKFEILNNAYNNVAGWKVKVFEEKPSKNGDYIIMKGSVGATKNEDGKYTGGMRVDVIVPLVDAREVSETNTYSVDGRIKWSVFRDCNGIDHNNVSIFATSVKPYIFRKRG